MLRSYGLVPRLSSLERGHKSARSKSKLTRARGDATLEREASTHVVTTSVVFICRDARTKRLKSLLRGQCKGKRYAINRNGLVRRLSG